MVLKIRNHDPLGYGRLSKPQSKPCPSFLTPLKRISLSKPLEAKKGHPEMEVVGDELVMPMPLFERLSAKLSAVPSRFPLLLLMGLAYVICNMVRALCSVRAR